MDWPAYNWFFVALSLGVFVPIWHAQKVVYQVWERLWVLLGRRHIIHVVHQQFYRWGIWNSLNQFCISWTYFEDRNLGTSWSIWWLCEHLMLLGLNFCPTIKILFLYWLCWLLVIKLISVGILYLIWLWNLVQPAAWAGCFWITFSLNFICDKYALFVATGGNLMLHNLVGSNVTHIGIVGWKLQRLLGVHHWSILIHENVWILCLDFCYFHNILSCFFKVHIFELFVLIQERPATQIAEN